jgi:hypothetical protein
VWYETWNLQVQGKEVVGLSGDEERFEYLIAYYYLRPEARRDVQHILSYWGQEKWACAKQ